MAEEEQAAAAAPVVKGDHNVSIVLSYMDDEHEKAAIEVGLSHYPRPPQPHSPHLQLFTCSCDKIVLRTKFASRRHTSVRSIFLVCVCVQDGGKKRLSPWVHASAQPLRRSFLLFVMP